MYRLVHSIAMNSEVSEGFGLGDDAVNIMAKSIMNLAIMKGYVPIHEVRIDYLDKLEEVDSACLRVMRYVIYIGKRKARIWLRHQKDKYFAVHEGFGGVYTSRKILIPKV
ncbi:hypothetical protein LCGC14_2842240 [marine sediment metagenome]|uniref:Uncharacterized protein n=1 Tax=marine sediment metagenome TaxID=412755 RepID=A0A0F8YB20_9ZZZZ